MTNGMSWLLPTLLSLVAFGLWGVVIKYATSRLDTVSISFFNTLSSLIVISAVFGYFWLTKTQLSFTREGIYVAVLAGVIAILAVLFEAMAYKLGSLAVIGPFIAVGVAVITVAAGVVLFKEPLTAKAIAGIFFALISIYLLSSA
jgi:drug/metabolite transporter (DMT)-like permease